MDVQAVRRGKERKREVFEPTEWPPKRREAPRREPSESPAPRRRKREKTPA